MLNPILDWSYEAPHAFFNSSMNLTKYAELFEENVHCLIAMADVRKLNAKRSTKVLRNLLHITERVVNNNMVILLGRKFSAFKKQVKKIQHKFIFAEETLGGGFNLRPFCPNCTKTATWPPVELRWNPDNGFQGLSPTEDIFRVCCQPLVGKRLRVLYNTVMPVIIRPTNDKRKCSPEIGGMNVLLVREIASILRFKVIICYGGTDAIVFGKSRGKADKVSKE